MNTPEVPWSAVDGPPPTGVTVADDLRELVAGRQLLYNLTLRELRGRYKRSVLGWTWSLLNPISSIVIYSVFVGGLLGARATVGSPSGLSNFPLFLTCALLPWNFLSTGVQAAIPSLVSNANLIRKVFFPREFIVVSAVGAFGVTLLIELGVLSVALGFFGEIVLVRLPLVLLLVALQSLMVIGLALALSVLNVWFRDIQHLASIFFQVWFYLTPVVYSPTLVAERNPSLYRFYRLNPMLFFTQGYRSLLYDGRLPTVATWIACVVSAVVFLVVGWAIFRRFQADLAEEL